MPNCWSNQASSNSRYRPMGIQKKGNPKIGIALCRIGLCLFLRWCPIVRDVGLSQPCLGDSVEVVSQQFRRVCALLLQEFVSSLGGRGSHEKDSGGFLFRRSEGGRSPATFSCSSPSAPLIGVLLRPTDLSCGLVAMFNVRSGLGIVWVFPWPSSASFRFCLVHRAFGLVSHKVIKNTWKTHPQIPIRG